ncbi:FGGY-family carbohydrate kinase [Lachnospiraceae bacterium 42-17]|jgi:erythritol kinase|nr:carbohydrate kinase [Dorea sp.]
MEKYIIGIDSGTTGIKAVLFDIQGKEIAKKGIPLQGYFPEENQYEEDMLEIWDSALRCVKEVAAKVDSSAIIGLGITAQGDGLWMVDENGEPVRRGCCFCDGRSAEFVDKWVEDGTCEKLFKACGTWVCTGNQNGIVRWMEKYEKDSLEKSRWLLHLKDYLFFKFTGEVTSDATDQSLILLDQRKRDYLDEAFALCGIEKYREKYPPVKSAEENAYKILPEVAEKTGLTEEVLVTSGPMDVGACALGSGVIEKGHCCSIMGTAALHEMVIDEPLMDDIPSGMTVTHVMEGRWLRLMSSFAGTPNLEWCLKTLGTKVKENAEAAGKDVYAYMEDMIKDVPIGSNGVMYHPYLLAGGERAPFTDSRARASYTGLNVRNTLADIVRATYEGVAFAMLDCYQHMPLPIEQITICGGGANSSAWCQMFADALGSRIVTVEGEELGARGVAINNAVVQGIFESYQDAVKKIVKVKKVYEPDMENHKKYMKFYELYTAGYKNMQKMWKIRAKIMKE